MPKPEGLVYKDIIGEIKEVKDDGTLVCAISTDAVDRMGEVLDPNGVDLKNYKQNPVVLWAHDYERPPIAKAQWVKKDGKQILSKLKFAPTPFAQEVKLLYEQGFMKTFSVGFIPKEWVDGDGDKSPTRKYTSWELLEYSAVPVPANPEALALAMKKGVIKDEQWTQYLPKEEKLQAFDLEEKEVIPEVKEQRESVQLQDSGLEDLQAENDLLKANNEILVKENAELSYKLYALLKEKQQQLSEITAKNTAKELGDEVRRVIRKLQGKID